MLAVTFVRHAMPFVDPDRDPSEWELTDASRAEAAALVLPPGPHTFVASTETKAVDTLRQLTDASVVTDARLCEVARPQAPDGHTHRALAAAYLAGTAHPGWEPHEAVAARFTAAIAHHLTAGRHLVVGTHGMALTWWLAGVADIGDPVAYWRALAFPEAITVALPEHWLRRRPAAT